MMESIIWQGLSRGPAAGRRLGLARLRRSRIREIRADGTGIGLPEP